MSDESLEVKHSRNFERSTKLIVGFLRVYGCLPDYRRTASRLQKVIVVYSCLWLLGNVYTFYTYFGSEPIQDYYTQLNETGFRMERHEETLMSATCVINFLFGLVIHVLYFLYSKRILNHLGKWVELEKFYFEKVKKDLVDPVSSSTLRWLLLLTAYNCVLFYIQFTPRFNFQIRPELSFAFFCILRYTDVLFLTIMQAASSAAKTISHRYLDNLEKGEHGDLLWLEAVWLKLAELIRDSGTAMAPILFLHMMRYAVLGLFFSYMICVRFMVLLDKTDFLILVAWTAEFATIYFFIWKITTCAYDAQYKVSQLAETLRHFLNEKECNLNQEITEQVISFQDTIVALPAKIELLDYMVVDKKLFVSINKLYLTYLIILVQFKIAEYNIKERLINQRQPTSAVQPPTMDNNYVQSPDNNYQPELVTMTPFLTTLTSALNFTPPALKEVTQP
ncbi:gustatory and odorant receptor 63a-like [Nilaparvata lugens]|uniref:gustatory and odorant receptor 63a-like n=1 Tax=Nilaparvata lugens TaxID=108931 RepID=UPI00193EB1D1|nr:gustatory and odorant receptor 63a-like [Nilaparvata lugens]